MRLLKDTMSCDVATTWGLSWFQSNGRVDMPAPGSTTWELSRTRTMNRRIHCKSDRQGDALPTCLQRGRSPLQV